MWLEFENAEDYDLQIGHELDKFQPILKAFEYEQAKNGPPSTQEFIDNVRAKNTVKHEFLNNIILEIEAKLK